MSNSVQGASAAYQIDPADYQAAVNVQRRNMQPTPVEDRVTISPAARDAQQAQQAQGAQQAARRDVASDGGNN